MISASPHLYRQRALERGVSTQIIERAIDQSQPPDRQGLPAILTLRHFTKLVGVDYEYVRLIIERKHDGYRAFSIRKRRGGSRLIAAPEPKLAAIQRWIADNILLKRPTHSASHAYSKGASSIKCASLHLGSRWLIKIDIHDFFESITERSVYFVFRECGYQPLISFELARLCTRISMGKSVANPKWSIEPARRLAGLTAYRSYTMGHLPQGAPTSPMLSNLTSAALDETFQKLADKYKLVYTRYSDDIAFSTGGEFSKEKAAHLISESEHILISFGHVLHRRKITIAPPGARKVVLGLLVDGAYLKLPREFRNKLSDHVRGIEKFGLAAHAINRHFASLWGLTRHLGGLLIYANAIDPKFASPLRKRLEDALKEETWLRSKA